ncbi:hypothetical protein ACFQZK_00805 [Rhodococcus aetherivorans]
MTTHDVRALVARWRALPTEEKVYRRRAAVVDHVIHSMAMEGAGLRPVDRAGTAPPARHAGLALIVHARIRAAAVTGG